jgi:hypothetical protein
MIEHDILLAQHRSEKEDSARFKERRAKQWNENYLLYRDKVITNRLTQRQAVNIPIIRETVQTWISKIDEQPEMKFEARGRSRRDKRGELFVNEMWDFNYEAEKLDLKDNIEKKIVGLQGRSFKNLMYRDGRVKFDIIDPYDIDIDTRVNPFDLNTASYLNHKHIYVPLRKILANKSYRKEGKDMLKHYLASREGTLKASDTEQERFMKEERLRSIGASNYDDYFSTDITIELNRSYKMMWSEEEKKFVRHLIVIAMDHAILYCEPLKKAIGIDYLPWVTWGSDPDINDIWSDGVADSVRTVNKVVNMYFSQDLENRSYSNFGMYFFNNQNGSFQPQAFEAKPFGMYGVPGNPDEMIKQMKIEPLEDAAASIEYLKNMVQSSVAQTPSERGEQTKSRTTLGEIELNLSASQGRNQVVAKQYRSAWEECGRIWYDLMKSNQIGNMTLYKKGKNGQTYSKDVSTADWRVPAGYEAKAMYKSEKEEKDDNEFRKLQFVKGSFQNNPIALRIARRKELEILGWDPDEIDEVMALEEQNQLQPMMDPNAAGGLNPQEAAAPDPVETQQGVSLSQPTT